MYGEDNESVARDVPQYSLDEADGGDVWNLVCRDKGGYKACDAENGTGDKNPQVFPEIVIHDAEIRVGNFEVGVGSECDDGGGDKRQ